ncbi:hypothetical protein N0V88_006033 [Collariella sp. IMI 366227]|nr:hypothetical protein N0V88_006033 [Collariella sp. IMI 366227]
MGSLAAAAAPFRVLIAGGAYAGLSAALNLQDLCRNLPPRCGPKPVEGETQPQVNRPLFNADITIVDERDGFYHLIGTPLGLASDAYASKCWVKYDEIPALQSPNIRVLQGSMKSVDLARKVATYLPHGAAASDAASELQYDYFVAATGLRRVWPVVPQSLKRKQYLFEMGDYARETTAGKHGVVVVGGGAVGIEMAAELKMVQPQIKVTLVHSRDKLLSSESLPDEAKDCSLGLVKEAGVEVLMNHRLDKTEEVTDEQGQKSIKVHFTNGHSILADQVSMAVSRSVPTSGYLPAEVLDEEGYVKIKSSLAFPESSPNAADHFAAGDMAKWSGIKRCGGAMHMGYFAANNIHQRVLQKAAGTEAKFLELGEIPPMIGLAVGKKAMSYWPEGGVNSGEDVAKSFFGDDLGFTICWTHLGLGADKTA